MTIEDLDPKLKALLSHERKAPLPGADAARAKIASSLFPKPAPKKPETEEPKPEEPKPEEPKPDAPKPDEPKPDAPKPGTSGSDAVWSTKALMSVAVGCTLIGALAGSAVTSYRLREKVPVAVGEAPALEDDLARVEAAVEVAAELEVEVESEVEAPQTIEMRRTREADTKQRPPSNLARERALIDQARTALRAGRAHDALVALMGHERQFARGSLAEERERLAVEALVEVGRRAPARRRAEAFLRDFPESAHRARVEAMLREL